MVSVRKTKRRMQRGGVKIQPTEVRMVAGTKNGYEYAIAEHAGYKEYRGTTLIRYNEDRAVVTPLGTTGLLVLVCDGHGGSSISDFVSKDLSRNLETALSEDILADVDEVQRILREAFASIAGEIRLMAGAYDQGTTCTVSVVTPTHIITAHLGDSPAVLMTKSGSLVAATKDHDFENEAEVQRLNDMYARFTPMQKKRYGPPIKVDGAGVKRLMGGLAMSRSFGDLQYAVYLSTEPEIQVMTRGPSQRLVVASDSFTEDFVYKTNFNGVSRAYGVRNVLSPSHIVTEVTPTLNETDKTLEERVKQITTARMNKFFYPGHGYANDNTTLVVVELPDPPAPAPAPVPAPVNATFANMPRGIHVGGYKKKGRKTRRRGGKRRA